MALTLKQKEILNYQLGVLEGLCWVATIFALLLAAADE